MGIAKVKGAPGFRPAGGEGIWTTNMYLTLPNTLT
jgi:hypothetical protein